MKMREVFVVSSALFRFSCRSASLRNRLTGAKGPPPPTTVYSMMFLPKRAILEMTVPELSIISSFMSTPGSLSPPGSGVLIDIFLPKIGYELRQAGWSWAWFIVASHLS